MNDLGIEAVELIYEMFKVDEQWSVKEKRGFRVQKRLSKLKN